MFYKLRVIANSGMLNQAVGITIPNDIAQFFSGCYFKMEIRHIGKEYGIFCISGSFNQPTKEEIKNYKFEDCKI